jgi:hypothetical protein
MPGNIIKCYPAFIEAFIKKTLYREVSTGKPTHTFARSPFFMRPDPAGGLPMRSTSVPNSHRTPEAGSSVPPLSPALWEETQVDNPYDMTIKDGKTELSTFNNQSSPVSVAPEVAELADGIIEDDIPEDNLDDSDDLDLDVEDATEISFEADQGPQPPTRTELRKKTADEIRELGMSLLEAGCPAHPEMLETFAEFTPETPRGPVFEALWIYFGYNSPEE